MNYALILKLISSLLRMEALFMGFPLAVSFIYGGEDKMAFIWAIAIGGVIGTLLSFVRVKDKVYKTRDAFAAVSLSWIFMSLLGALPFYFSGHFKSFIDCMFESISGFTTTGSTILTDVESIPKGILFWRSFMHWIGGMGVLVFMLAIMPTMNASSVNLLRAESTGPAPNKIVPKIRETAKYMYLIYLGMTVLLICLLLLARLPLYDTFITAFSIAGTGGFSNMNASVGAYNNIPAEIISSVFMFLFGVSFSLYYLLIKRNFRQFFKDEELRFFFIIVAVSILIITFNIAGMYGSVLGGLRHASFQVTTIISTTGFATTDFNLWPMLSRVILVLLMLTGCCAGSTGGGLKLIRVLLLVKAARNEVNKILYPKSVNRVTINGKKTDNDIILKTFLFFFIYIFIMCIAVIIISVDGKDFETNVTAVISCLSNIGPGLGAVGPVGNYSVFSPLSKIVLSFCMLAGRLEFMPVLVLFKPVLWKKQGA